MGFIKARNLGAVFALAAVAILAFGIVCLEDGTIYMTIDCIAALISMAVAVVICAKWCVCPKCGKHVFNKVFMIKRCPYCNGILDQAAIQRDMDNLNTSPGRRRGISGRRR